MKCDMQDLIADMIAPKETKATHNDDNHVHAKNLDNEHVFGKI